MSDIDKLNEIRRSHMTDKERADDDYQTALNRQAEENNAVANAINKEKNRQREANGHLLSMGSGLCSMFMAYNNPRTVLNGAIQVTVSAFRYMFMEAADGGDVPPQEQTIGKKASISSPGITAAREAPKLAVVGPSIMSGPKAMV